MQGLIEHLLHPLLQHPEEMKLNVIEGKASILVQLKVHDDDVDVVLGENESHIHAVRHILSIASGKRKPSLELVKGEFTPAPVATEEVEQSAEEAVESAEEVGESTEEVVETAEEASAADSSAEDASDVVVESHEDAAE